MSKRRKLRSDFKARDIRDLHTKIGQLTVENDFLSHGW